MNSVILIDFVYPAGKPMTPHLLCYQGLAVDDYGFALYAADMGHPRFSLNEGLTFLVVKKVVCTYPCPIIDS
jgi:hypothetical protein